MLDPEHQKQLAAELEAHGFEAVKTDLEAGIYGQLASNERARAVQQWIWRKEREDDERRHAADNTLAREANALAREANALAAAANELSERAERRATSANRIAVAAAIVALAGIIVPVLIDRARPSTAPVSAAPSGKAYSSSQP